MTTSSPATTPTTDAVEPSPSSNGSATTSPSNPAPPDTQAHVTFIFEFLAQHRHHQQLLKIISSAEARGQARMAEMNRQVTDNLAKVISSWKTTTRATTPRRRPMRPDNTTGMITSARRRRELTRAKAVQALRELDRTGTPVTFDAVARATGISRSWLYGEADLRAEIQRLRQTTRRAPDPPIPTENKIWVRDVTYRGRRLPGPDRILTAHHGHAA